MHVLQMLKGLIMEHARIVINGLKMHVLRIKPIDLNGSFTLISIILINLPGFLKWFLKGN